ncbi:MAG TPA: hypothetical protein PKW42_05880, partial [bacterium]|nr:hypothetical protein [bacterium]
ANLWPAVLAGLAYPGWHGHPLSPRYGVRQRFVAVVTDMVLPEPPLLSGSPCAECNHPCLKACPTQAIASPGRPSPLRGKNFCFHRWMSLPATGPGDIAWREKKGRNRLACRLMCRCQ